MHPFGRLCLSLPKGGPVLSVILQHPQRSPCSTIHPLCTLMSGPHSQDTANPLARTCIPFAFLPFPSAIWQQAAGPSLPIGGHFWVCLGKMGGLSILLLPPTPPTASCKCAKVWRIEPALSISVAVPGCRMMVGRSLGAYTVLHMPQQCLSLAFVICDTGCSLLPQEKKIRAERKHREHGADLLPPPTSQGCSCVGKPRSMSCVSPVTDSRVGRWQWQWWLEHPPWRALQPAPESL